jgi:hypothetical protein
VILREQNSPVVHFIFATLIRGRDTVPARAFAAYMLGTIAQRRAFCNRARARVMCNADHGRAELLRDFDEL